MNVSIDFPEEIEDQLRRRAAEAGQDVESYIRRVVTEEVSSGLPAAGAPTHDDFSARLRETILRHGIHQGRIDDSRESIYAGRGE